MTAPLNLMVHPGRPQLALDAPFDLREVEASGNFDVKAGASTLADLSQAQRFALMACTNCGRCDSVCPAFASGTALSPRQLVQGLRSMQMAGDSRTDLLNSGNVSIYTRSDVAATGMALRVDDSGAGVASATSARTRLLRFIGL